jgi:isopentenyl-diphosphate delta-isomerase
MGKTYVVLVDENDNPLGVMEKMEAHREARLHRAISVFLFNLRGEWVLQKRALDKYHSRGLWTNACCTHPYPGESETEAAKRRLMEEMGINCEVKEIFNFVYKEKLDNNLTEFELDHVFVATTDEYPVINTNEVLEWKSISFDNLRKEVFSAPEDYTFWFKEIFERVHDHLLNKNNH